MASELADNSLLLLVAEAVPHLVELIPLDELHNDAGMSRRIDCIAAVDFRSRDTGISPSELLRFGFGNSGAAACVHDRAGVDLVYGTDLAVPLGAVELRLGNDASCC